ncbi:hypothetical protein M0811_02823 [Anaeramoeba ignava]|uniref:Kelch repeat-containing protein n=1 Tax=Anaeramoeba ignava TaxID=1746090 RepID=A0A9Q0L912_ANAIG|nr:hypothetical protein M0811_02823 [Anaeramoeba ignava]
MLQNEILCYWNLLETNQQPRGTTSCAFARSENKLIIVGGNSQRISYNDTYSFDLETHQWDKIKTSGEFLSVRIGHTISLYNNSVWLFGGYDGEMRNDIFILDLKTHIWRKLPQPKVVPKARLGHTSVVFEDTMIIFGGWNSNAFLDDLWQFSFKDKTWKELETTGKAPTSRNGHHSVMISSYEMVIFGGRNEKFERINDLYILDLKKMEWTEILALNEKPKGRAGGSLIQIDDSNLLVFGGKSEPYEFLSDCWIFNLISRCWTKLEPLGFEPRGRAGHCHIYDSDSRSLFVFGGGRILEENKDDYFWETLQLKFEKDIVEDFWNFLNLKQLCDF